MPGIAVKTGNIFESLFPGTWRYIHPRSEVYMVLFDGCDMEMIDNLASQSGFELECVQTRENLLEKNYVFKIVFKEFTSEPPK